MWTYSQSTGQLSQDGVPVACGYSGCGDFKYKLSGKVTHASGRMDIINIRFQVVTL